MPIRRHKYTQYIYIRVCVCVCINHVLPQPVQRTITTTTTKNSQLLATIARSKFHSCHWSLEGATCALVLSLSLTHTHTLNLIWSRFQALFHLWLILGCPTRSDPCPTGSAIRAAHSACLSALCPLPPTLCLLPRPNRRIAVIK